MERFVYRPVPYYKTCRMLKNLEKTIETDQKTILEFFGRKR